MKTKNIWLAALCALCMGTTACDDDYLHPIEYPVPVAPSTGDDDNKDDDTEYPTPAEAGNKVVAHRGGATEAGATQHPDNSLASLKYAIDLGVYASECDIYRTKDDRVVVAHATDGCLINGLRPWEHTLAELQAAGTLSNGETLPTLEQFIDATMASGRTRLWLDVKRIEENGKTAHTDESIRACTLSCEIIVEKRAKNFCEFIVSGNKTIWDGCYATARKNGIACGWMSYSSPDDYRGLLDPWANLDYTRFFKNEAAVANPRYMLQSYIDAGIALSIYNADTTAEIVYILPYYPKMKAVCTNYPARLLAAIEAQ